MMKFKFLGCIFLLTLAAQAQLKQEQEFRVDREQLPNEVLPLLEPYLMGAKRIRYYQEIDGDKASFEVKFKKDRLLYSVEFAETGELQDVEFIIKPKDIPEDSFNRIRAYLSTTYEYHRIKKIQQQYLNLDNPKETLYEAFQNLLMPHLNYECIVATKENGNYTTYEITFDASGTFMKARKVVNPKYDHVLFN